MTRGFSTLEVLIALMILSSTLVAITLLALGMPRVLESTRVHREALALASGELSRELARGVDAFGIRTPHATTTHEYFQHALRIESVGSGESERIVSSVSWNDEFGQRRYLTLSSLVSDYEHAASDPCGGFLIGDWSSPSLTVSSQVLPPLADLTTSRDRLIAIASTTAHIGDPALFLFPREATGIPGTPTDSLAAYASTTIGFMRVTASSDTIYAITSEISCANTIPCARFDTIAIEDEGRLSRTYSTPIPPARSIEYAHGLVFIGLRAYATGPEFLIFAVLPGRSPQLVGTAEIGFTVNAIVADSHSAYLATSDNSASSARALMAFDIEVPSFGMSPATTSAQSGAGIAQHLALSGDRLYLGRSSPLHSKEFYVFSTHDLKGSKESHDVISSITGLATRGFLAFVLTKNHLEVWDTESGDKSRAISQYPVHPGSVGTSLTCSSRSVLIASADSDSGFITALTGS